MPQSGPEPVWIWTTFSANQVDLNYKNPLVLLFIIETVLFYVRWDADLLRLDAVTFLWREPGIQSVHFARPMRSSSTFGIFWTWWRPEWP